jgi:hypothetical protein
MSKGLPRSLEALYERVTQLEIDSQQLGIDSQAAINGGIALSLSPATLGSSAAAVNTAIGGDGFTRDVAIQLLDGDSEIVRSNGSFAIAATKDSTSGTVTIEDDLTSINLVDGEATVTLVYAGTWADADTCTLTVTGGTVAGNTVADKTSVDTLVA